LPGALELLELLNRRGLPFCFLTNNTSHSKLDYIRKLRGLGVREEDARVYTAGDATIAYLNKHHSGKKVFLLGTPSLAQSFCEGGIALSESDPDLVVIGYDTSLTYDRISAFCRFVRKGLPYIATHPDVKLPHTGRTSARYRRDDELGGGFHRAQSGCRDWQAQPWDRECAGGGMGAQAGGTGYGRRRLYTDIALGQTAGVRTVLVLSGETRRADLANAKFKPDLVCETLTDLTRDIIS